MLLDAFLLLFCENIMFETFSLLWPLLLVLVLHFNNHVEKYILENFHISELATLDGSPARQFGRLHSTSSSVGRRSSAYLRCDIWEKPRNRMFMCSYMHSTIYIGNNISQLSFFQRVRRWWRPTDNDQRGMALNVEGAWTMDIFLVQRTQLRQHCWREMKYIE